jgi:uncharacterized protein
MPCVTAGSPNVTADLLTRESLPPDLEEIAGRVAAGLPGAGRLGVAFSGGVDSSVLLALAVRAFGAEAVVAILAVSPSLAASERTAAHQVADLIGVRLVEMETYEGERAAYRANGADRCFHCKDELFTRIEDTLAEQLSLTAVAYGENADDALRPDRPGSRAATQHTVLRPLAEAGITKAQVRDLARALQLPNADKPAAPCLASRIPHHQPVTPAKLAAVEAAEKVLWDLGFRDGRVRHHGDVARIELTEGELARAVRPAERRALLDGVRAAGFRFVAVDLAGIQSGAFTLPLVSVPPVSDV